MGRVTHYDTVQMMAYLLGQRENVAKYYVTVTAGQTHTINSLGVSAATVVSWGDGLSNEYTGTAMRTHVYSNAGTYCVKIYTPENVTAFDLRDGAAVSVLNSADIKLMVNISTFQLHTLPNVTGTLNSSDMVEWRPSTFYLNHLLSATGTINSADMVEWRPSTFTLSSLSSATGTINSADMVDWRPSSFYLNSLSNATGTISSADMVDWRPSTFQLNYLPSATVTINSADMVDWLPSTFTLENSGNVTGTINSADMVDWRPSSFNLHNLLSATVTINSADMVEWRPSTFTLSNLSNATITITPGAFSGYTGCTNFYVQNCNITTPQLDIILHDLYLASIAPRTATGGTINLSGASNGIPTGTFQACASPPVSVSTPGKEIAYELKNDSLSVGFNKWATVNIN